MDINIIIVIGLRVLAVAGLVFLNGFFVAAEFALVKTRDTQLDALITQGNRRAIATRRVLRRLDSSLSACQLGITVASLGLGWIGEPVFQILLGPVLNLLNVQSPEIRETAAVMVGFSVITFLHITAGEQAPKWLAIQKPLATVLWVAVPLQWFHAVSYPLIWALNHSSQWMLGLVGLRPVGEDDEGGHSEEELRLLFATARRLSDHTHLGFEIAMNALDLRQRVVREVMRPRQEIVVLNTEASIAECLAVAGKTRYSRFPLCEQGDVDRSLGVVHIKDLYALQVQGKKGRDLLASARKLIYLPETARLEKLLRLFLDRKLHLAIVVDEYGGTVGLLTLENVLEALVGQIQDEFDQEKPLCVKTGDQTYELSGAFPLRELSELVGEPLTSADAITTSGWVTERLGGFPKPGDSLTGTGWDLHIEEMEGPRVAQLKLVLQPRPSDATRPDSELARPESAS